MIINNKKIPIDDLLADINWENNTFQKVNSELILTNYQVAVLKKNKIPFESATSLNNLIYLINDSLGEIEDEELELILNEITERNYYENTNK